MTAPDCRSRIGEGYVVEVDECLVGGRTCGEVNSVLDIAARVEGPTYEGLYSGAWQHPNSGGE